MACATWPPKRPDCESRKPSSASEPSPANRGRRRLCEGHCWPGLRRRAGAARLQFLAFAGFPGRYRPKPEPFIRARQARRHAGRSSRALPEVPKNLDRSSICKMGAVRKTGNEAPSGGAGGDERPSAVGADRVAYLTVGPESEGQRLDNFL